MIMSSSNVMNTLDCSLAALLQGSLRCCARHWTDIERLLCLGVV